VEVENPAWLDYPVWLKYYELEDDDTPENYDKWLAGLDPRDPLAKFYATIKVVEGKPVVGWVPDLGHERRKYTIMGKVNLNNPDPWIDIPLEAMATTPAKFFKVRVEKWP